MESGFTFLASSVGSLALFGFLAFAIWMDYCKKKDERDTAHRERMKALELGHPPFDAEIARARAYASAAWAAGVIGLVVPLVVVSLTVIATIVAILHEWAPWQNIAGPLIVAWSIACGLSLVTIVLSLHAIRRLPRPSGEAPARDSVVGKRGDPDSGEFQEKRLEL
jgi:Ni/Fe-hydrogenase subunit HybB-like protein